MTDTTAREGYERIGWPEARAGDVLMHENGDRVTVDRVNPEGDLDICALGQWRFSESMAKRGLSPYRKVEPLPTTPGAYLDKDGNAWLRDDGWDERPWIGQGYADWLTPEEVSRHAPFTRLVQMPTEEQIRETLFKTDPGTIYGVDAVVDGMKTLMGCGNNE